ncbi:MAG: hypothetical protein IKF90_18545 [Parasporobacterium sp.]|nr:hypothetical protein [Parasporobacterium sp.]
MPESVYEARKEEGPEISRLLESPVDAGLIQAIYTRRPDAYESYMKEFGESRVFVFRKEGRVIGTCSQIIRNVYVDGKEKRSAYICGLKKDSDYQGHLSAGLSFFRTFKRPDIDFYYCAVVSNNKDAVEKFEKKRDFMSVKCITTYDTYFINPKVKTKEIKNEYRFRQASVKDTDALLEFLNTEGKKKDLFPVIKSLDDFYNLHAEDFYILEDDHEMKACAALWNTTSYKQLTITKFKGILKLARLLNPLLSLLAFPTFNKENESYDYPILSFFLSKDDNKDYYEIFFHRIKNEIKKNYRVFAVGLTRNHPIASVMKNLPKITGKSTIYEVKLSGQKEENISFNTENIATEFALL